MTQAPSPSTDVLDAFFDALAPRIDGDLRRDAMTCALYATDASMYQIVPHGVLLPRRDRDVQAALEEASQFQVPVLPRGGGSSLAGQTVGRALIIDFSRYMDGVLEIDPEAKVARVQPGVVLDSLNRACAEHGLMVGPDPASANRATVGGMVANNATGTHSILYGNTLHHVERLRGFLASGAPIAFEPLGPAAWQARSEQDDEEGQLYRSINTLLEEEGQVIRRDTPRHWRRSSGYRLEYLLPDGAGTFTGGPFVRSAEDAPLQDERNMAHVMCGSEGTLAVITEIEIRLVDKPQHTVLGIAHFETRDQALREVTAVLETNPSAVELFDGVAIDRCRRTPGFAERLTFINGEPGGVLITEYSGDSTEELEAKLSELEENLSPISTCYDLIRLTDPDEISNVWSIRKEGLGLIMGVQSEFKPIAFIEDASVPVEHLADYVKELAAVLDETNTRAAFYAHASAGCLHIRPFINTKDRAEVEKMVDIATRSMELVAQHGGAISSEHGDGLARSWLNGPFLGPELCAVYQRLKDIFDPNGILNPGKIVDSPPMDQNLRLGPDYGTIPILPEMDFSEDGSFSALVEKCNGNGACRKLESGTMCPSFMVTKEEKDSTRGRANALRMAISGAVPAETLYRDSMHDVMDLCIQCKACKTECPSNVDMAKLKSEWLSMYWSKNRVPFRTRIFAHLPRLSRKVAGSSLAKAANRINRSKSIKRLVSRSLGISTKRSLPPFATETFDQWYARQEWDAVGPPVVLFAGTFENYHDVAVAESAARVFKKIGMEVQVPDETVCCGRTLLSKGLVSEAQVQALETVAALYPYAAQGVPIVGLEPSCILALSDEFRDLLPGDPRTEQVARHALTFETFFARLADSEMLDGVQWKDEERNVLLHGHCHQKALVGTEPAERILSLPPGYSVSTVDSGCCGMAGAFGYEKEHYEISRQMGERRLAPAVRATSEDTIIAAAGYSCRSQIKDLTGRKALHPAQILLDAME